MSAITPDTLVPPHVDAARVFAFDLFHDERMADDVHEGLKTLHSEAPDIFYTPLNGGHWMITRHEDVSHVLRDYEHFTNVEMDIPKMGSRYVMIPLNLDPPEHTPYRTILMRYFSPQVVKGMDKKLHEWAALHIDRVVADGRCDIAKVGTAFPVSVFLEMMGLPLERFDEFRAVVVEYFGLAPVEHRNKLRGWIFDLMQEAITERRAAPGADLISRLIGEEVDGRKLTDDELKSICFLLFIAGLDTVANAISFSMNFLAKDPAMQAKLAAEPESIRDFVEEALRRFSPVNGSRMVKKDFEYGGVLFKAGDMVCTSQPLAGLDERANPDPMTFDITRKERQHTAFSVGPHLCVGHYLARNEMRIFLEEWLQRIPRFRPAPDVKPKPRAGKVMSIKHVEVEWDVAPPSSTRPKGGSAAHQETRIVTLQAPPSDARLRVGYIGLGDMGGAMVRNLAKKGWRPVIYARREASLAPFREEDVEIAASPADVGAACDLLCLCVVDADQVSRVLFGERGAVCGMRPGSVVVIHSTLTPEECRELGKRLALLQIDLIDAPVSGAAARARKGELTISIGGRADVVKRCLPLLDAEASSVLYMGETGSAQAAKLLNNALFFVQLSLVDEAVKLGIGMGLSGDTQLELINSGSAGSWASERYAKIRSKGRSLFGGHETSYPGGLRAIVQKDMSAFAGQFGETARPRLADLAQGAVEAIDREPASFAQASPRE